jgi:hypothetical protein
MFHFVVTIGYLVARETSFFTELIGCRYAILLFEDFQVLTVCVTDMSFFSHK